MSTQANSKPARTPVIRHAPAATTGSPVNLLRFLPAAVISAVVHVGLGGGLYFLASPDTQAGLVETVKSKNQDKEKDEEANTVKQDEKPVQDEEPPPPAVQEDEKPEETLTEAKEITSTAEREGEVTVPGEVVLKEPIGVTSAADGSMKSFSGPQGLGGGTGGAQVGVGDATGTVGTGGGYVGGGLMKPGGFYGRSGATKKKLLQMDGGTEESEAAVNRGLDWFARHQASDGHWSLDHFNQVKPCNCRGTSNHHNDTAATAFGLLPYLGAGYTHKPSKDKNNPNRYQKQVTKAIGWLIRHQKGDGDFGGGMYSHGLATIAMCEVYAMTQDIKLKRVAQAAVNFIVKAQHNVGGWRYRPGMEGDISVVGWQVMALKSAQMGNLNVPARTMKKAQDYLDTIMSDNTCGYGYLTNNAGELTPTRTAIALLCRQYIQGLGPASPIMSKGVDNYIKKAQPANGKNMYYYYYATQVLHHFGGKNWAEWNVKMRDILVKEQIRGEKEPAHKDEDGSYDPTGDVHGAVGGRVMQTSLSLLTLEVYYRHLPLYRRDVMDKKDLAAK